MDARGSWYLATGAGSLGGTLAVSRLAVAANNRRDMFLGGLQSASSEARSSRDRFSSTKRISGSIDNNSHLRYACFHDRIRISIPDSSADAIGAIENIFSSSFAMVGDSSSGFFDAGYRYPRSFVFSKPI